jgi:WD40 repeat protein
MRLSEFEGHGGDTFAVSPDGEIMVVEDAQVGRIEFVRMQDGRTIQTIDRPAEAGEEGRILSAFSPDSRLYAVGAANGGISVWQLGEDGPLYTLTSPFEWNDLIFSPDGSRLVLASDAIQLFDPEDGSLINTLEGQSPYFAGEIFSPDGSVMVSGDGERVNLWRVDDGTLSITLEAQLPALFSADGAIIVTSGEGLIQFWNASDGALMHTLNSATIPSAFSPDGRWLISTGDGVVEMWGIPVP